MNTSQGPGDTATESAIFIISVVLREIGKVHFGKSHGPLYSNVLRSGTPYDAWYNPSATACRSNIPAFLKLQPSTEQNDRNRDETAYNGERALYIYHSNDPTEYMRRNRKW